MEQMKEPVTKKRGKRAKRGEAQSLQPSKFYLGTIKDGVPEIEKEVSELDAMLDNIKTGKPFISIHLWQTEKSDVVNGSSTLSRVPAN